jgi:hypothetical protein
VRETIWWMFVTAVLFEINMTDFESFSTEKRFYGKLDEVCRVRMKILLTYVSENVFKSDFKFEVKVDVITNW